MKRAFLVALALLVLATTACEKINDLLTFYINHEKTITIESSFPLDVGVPLMPVAVTTNSEETFKNNKTRAELVKDITLNKLTLTITDPEGESFDFLESIEIYISNEKDGETRIAFLDKIPQGANSVTLESTNTKLDNYLKEKSYTIRTKATLKKPLSRDISIKAAMRFKVTANPI